MKQTFGKMMKSTREDCREVQYPCLMESTVGTKEVVLMTSEGVGTVVYVSEDSLWKKGEYSEYWNMILLKPYCGSITLSND